MIEVWQLDLDRPDWDALAFTLDTTESSKARRYATAVLQARYRRCRSALRALLGRRLGRAPAALEFQTNEWGKPALLRSACHFNVSHSEARALVVLADEPVGIDIERVGRNGIEVDELAPLVFHPRELDDWKAVPPSLRALRFYEAWTAKEAYCKARGEGLQIAMPSVRIAGSKVEPDEAQLPHWHVHRLWCLAGHSAHLCIAQASIDIQIDECLPRDFL